MEFWPEFLASSGGQEFVAGGIGGMAGIVAGHPLDTLKIRQQQPHLSPSSGPTSAMALLRHMVATEGPLSLFKGMSSPLATIAFQFLISDQGYTSQNAIIFQTYALLSRALSEGSEPLSYGKVLMAGLATGTIQTAILTPVDLVKIRLQLATDRRNHKSLSPGTGSTAHQGPLSIAREIMRKEGIKGLYRGQVVTMLRDAPGLAVYFGTYEYARELLHPGCRKNGKESVMTMLTAGGLAGALSWIVCYPVDVAKSRLQAQSGHDIRYHGIADCLRKIIQEEGASVLWRGLGTAVTRAYICNGAIFSAYELTLRFLSAQQPAPEKIPLPS